MLKVRNNRTGQIEEVPESQLAEGVTAGLYSVEKGVKLPVLTPEGQPGTIDSSEAATAFQSGFTYDTTEQQEERRKSEQYGNRPVAAAALGAARALSFGGSDQALAGTGLVDQETLQQIKERNPELSMVGEAGAVIVPAVVSGGTSLLAKGAMSGVNAATRAGLAAESTVGKVLAKRLAQQGEMSLARKVLANAGAKGAGSAVEGAFYGAGHIISEDALGNAELNAESLLANMGVGTLIGGVTGGVLGGGGALVNEAADATVNAAKGLVESRKPFFRRLLGAKDSADEVSILGSLSQKKANVGDLRDRAQRLEVQLTTGTESANDVVRRAESTLNETPSFLGEEVKRVTESNRGKLQTSTAKVFDEASKRTEREVGSQVVDEMRDIMKTKYDPFNVAYAEIRKHTPHIEIDPIGMERTAKIMSKLGGDIGAKGGAISKYTGEQAGVMAQQRTLQDLNNFISEVKSQARAFRQSGNGQMAFAADQVARSAERLSKRTILREADKMARFGAPEAQLAGQQLIQNIRTTNRQYAEFMGFVRALGQEGKLGKRGSYSQIMERLDSLDPEQVAKKFFDPRRLDSILFMQKNFPKQFEELRTLKLAEMANKVTDIHPTHGPQYNINTLRREFDNLGKTPEYRDILLGPTGVQTIDDVTTLHKVIPGVSNPSGTDIRKDFERLLTPVLWARDTALLGILKGAKMAESREANLVKGVQSLSQVEKSQKSITKSITKALNSFLSTEEKVRSRIPVLATNAIMDTSFSPESKRKKKDETLDAAFHKRADEIAAYMANPQMLTNRLANSTAILGHVAPKHAAALHGKAINAIRFLHEKLPSNPAAGRSSNLSIRKWTPSTVEMKKFERYLKAVDKPTSVLDDFADGKMSREGVETLQVVYPEMYDQIVAQVTDRITELRLDLPYKKRLALGNLLDIPIDLAQQPDFLASLQMMFQPKEEEQQQAPQPSSSALAKVDMASATQTETQRIANRT